MPPQPASHGSAEGLAQPLHFPPSCLLPEGPTKKWLAPSLIVKPKGNDPARSLGRASVQAVALFCARPARALQIEQESSLVGTEKQGLGANFCQLFLKAFGRP